jgi:[Acyl-carrier-protein] S-malonyltransferase (EC 2.3.1.39)
MKIKISSLTLLVLTVFAGLAVQARAQIVNCIVAVVDDQPITRVDVLVALEFGLCDASNATGDPRTAAAWALVDRKLAVRTLRGQWVPGQEETESVLQSLKKEAGAAKFAAGLAAFDLIESDLLPYIREKVAYDKILAARFNRSVLVSRGDIERYYRDVLVPERKSRGMEPGTPSLGREGDRRPSPGRGKAQADRRVACSASGNRSPSDRSGLSEVNRSDGRNGHENIEGGLPFSSARVPSMWAWAGTWYDNSRGPAPHRFGRRDTRLPALALMFEGPEEELKLTENTQPAILTVSLAAFRLLGEAPAAAAGHSLGEYSAVTAAGSLRFEDAVLLVHKRGRYMQEAVPVGEGAMAAVLGVSGERIAEALAGVSSGVVEIANWNSDEQVVISGEKKAVEEALERIKPPRSVMLPVSAPFHSRLMKPAEDRLAVDLDAVTFLDPAFPVITNVDAEPVRDRGRGKERSQAPGEPFRPLEEVDGRAGDDGDRGLR